MIVKNEEHVIEKCLESVAPHIDAYSIVDTGSTDRTIEIVRNFFASRDIPGDVHSRPWVNFGHNRTESLELARSYADYSLVIDADDVLIGTPDFSQLSADGYMVDIRLDSLRYKRVQLFANRLPWVYKGVVHEYPHCEEPVVLQNQPDTWAIEAHCAGSRSSDPDKYKRDAELLSKCVEEDPNDRRSMFYLAQSLFDDGQFEKADEIYWRRVLMGGWKEEVFYSLFKIGLCRIRSCAGDEQIIGSLLNAWSYEPRRAEPLYYLARWAREKNNFALSAMIARAGTGIERPADSVLFVEEDVYTWKLIDELAISCYYTGKYEESFKLSSKLLETFALPKEHAYRIQANRNAVISALTGVLF